jgi:Tol biopolymer transport system component
MSIHRRSIRAALLASLAGALAALGLAPPAGATYPGQNGLIVFRVTQPDGTDQLFTVRPDGHGLRQITSGNGGDEADWAPDGRHIIYTTYHDGADCVNVEVMNPDGTGRAALTSGAGGCQSQASYAPDGSIVFENFDFATGDDAVWGMNADGSGQHRIVGLEPAPGGVGFAFATDPNVSPDSRTLTFVGWDGSLLGPAPAFEPAQGLFSSGLDGSNRAQLLPYSLDLAIKHDWAPDGSRILVGTNANFFDAADSANCATIAPDGSDLRYLTHYHEPGVNAFCGSYSPDGRYVVVRLEDHGSYALYTLRTDGSHPHKVLGFSTSFKPRNIDWGPRPSEDEG